VRRERSAAILYICSLMSHRKDFLRYMAPTSPAPIGIEVVHARGVWLKAADGKRYMDLISGISVSSLGHNNGQVRRAVQKQLRDFSHLMVYGELVQGPQAKLAKYVCSVLPEPLNSVYFVNSGSEAIEGALKLAKRVTGRPKMVAFKQAYHGSSHGALSIMGDPGFREAFRPLLPGITHIAYNSAEQLECITEETACVVIEPIQGEAGAVPGLFCFMRKLQQKCKEKGVLLICDEIQTGCGRTGRPFAFMHYGIVPDIIVVAKAFGGGLPLGAFISKREYMQQLAYAPVLGHITTFGGHPLSCAASLAALKQLLNPELLAEVKRKEALFRSLLVHPKIKGVSGRGLLLAIDLAETELNFAAIRECMAKGLLTDWFLFNDRCMRVAPPLVISDAEIRKACKVILEVLDSF
jgi:acetylornithine/N-succinyldiaminopimelate aminotransferase